MPIMLGSPVNFHWAHTHHRDLSVHVIARLLLLTSSHGVLALQIPHQLLSVTSPISLLCTATLTEGTGLHSMLPAV